MADYIPLTQWVIPNVFVNTTQQSAAEINSRYQKLANCGEFLRTQAVTLANAAIALLAEIDAALANFTAQQTAFNSMAVDAGNKVSTANTLQASAATSLSTLNTNNAAVITARAKLTTADSNANGVINNGMVKSGTNLDAIASAIRANPGILGLNGSSVWTWYSAPSGTPFVIEFQTFSGQYASTSNGGSVTAGAWNLVDINSAGYGSFKNAIGFPQNVVEEFSDRLNLKEFTHYWQAVILGSNTDSMRARFTLDGVGIDRSLSTQMGTDSNTNTLRHYNQDLIIDAVIIPTIETAYLRLETYHPAVNTAISTAAKGLSGNKGIENVYMVGYGFRVRNI
jgi:hypothetical protein